MPYSVGVEDLETIRGEWEQLLPYCVTNTIFVTPGWQGIWWRHFGNGWEQRILSVRIDGEILGIAPLMVRDGVVSFLGETDLFDYHDFLIRRGGEEPFYDTLWDYLAKLDWHTLNLTSLPQESSTLKYFPAMVVKKGVSVEVVEEDAAPIARLPSTWDEYLSGLLKKQRHELRRKLRRLERADHAHQYTCADAETLEGCMQDFFRLLRASSPEKMLFLTPERERFFVDVALEFAPKGQFKLFFLEVNDVRVASCICFDYADSYLLYNSGYDPNYSALSVGLINKALCIQQAIEEGRLRFDFLRGNERYKYDLGGKNQVVYRITVRR